MSKPRLPQPCLLVLSALSACFDELWTGLVQDLERRFGPVLEEYGPHPFTHTGYYDDELGGSPERRFLAFATLLPPDRLAWAKCETLTLERSLAREDGSRRVNLDPGLLSLERLVLATGKNYTHRIYLGRGIWADLTLIYQRGAWQSLPWTFPDYAGRELQQHLRHLREQYRILLAAGANVHETHDRLE